MKENSRLKYIILNTAVLLIGLLTIGLFILIGFLKYNFSNQELSTNSVLIFIPIIFFTLICYYLIELKKNKPKFPFWFSLTIITMILFGIIGIVFIQNTVGKQEMDMKLFYKNSREQFGSLDCKSSYVQHEPINCVIKPQLSNYSINLTFSRDDGGKVYYNLKNKGKFLSPEKTNHVAVKIEGKNSKNQTLILESGIYHRFFTYEENLERKDKLVAYIIGLITLIFISVPQMMLSIRRLWRDKD